MDSKPFYGFINRLFIPHTKAIPGPKLLILDGHGEGINQHCEGPLNGPFPIQTRYFPKSVSQRNAVLI